MNLPSPIGPIEIVEVYVEHEEPLLYLAKNSRGELFLVVLVDDGDEEQVWHFAPVSKRRIDDIRAGLVDLRDAFLRVEHGVVIALHRERREGGYERTRFINADALTDDALPQAGRRLSVPNPAVILPNTREIAVTQRRVVAALRFIPQRREEKEVNVVPFTQVLQGIQGSLDAIGQDLHAKHRASIPKKDRSKRADQVDPRLATQLKAADRFAASFGIELHSAQQADYFTGESLAGDAMAKLIALLEVVGDEEALTERLGEFKGTATAGRLRTLLTGVGQGVQELQIEWASPKPDFGGRVCVSDKQASVGVSTIARMRPEEPVEHWVTGYFSEIGDEPATFHFFEDADKPRHFAGRVDEGARRQVPNVNIRITKYRVRIVETVERNFEGDVKPKHRLMQIAGVDDPDPVVTGEPNDEAGTEGEPYPGPILFGEFPRLSLLLEDLHDQEGQPSPPPAYPAKPTLE